MLHSSSSSLVVGRWGYFTKAKSDLRNAHWSIPTSLDHNDIVIRLFMQTASFFISSQELLSWFHTAWYQSSHNKECKRVWKPILSFKTWIKVLLYIYCLPLSSVFVSEYDTSCVWILGQLYVGNHRQMPGTKLRGFQTSLEPCRRWGRNWMTCTDRQENPPESVCTQGSTDLQS